MLFIEYITFFRVIITLTNFGELISENKIFVWSIRDIVGDKTARNSQIVSTMVFPLKILMMWRNTCPWSSKPNLKMRTEWCKSRCRNVFSGETRRNVKQNGGGEGSRSRQRWERLTCRIAPSPAPSLSLLPHPATRQNLHIQTYRCFNRLPRAFKTKRDRALSTVCGLLWPVSSVKGDWIKITWKYWLTLTHVKSKCVYTILTLQSIHTLIYYLNIKMVPL